MSESITSIWPTPFEPEAAADPTLSTSADPSPETEIRDSRDHGAAIATDALAGVRRYPAAAPGELPVVEIVPRTRIAAPRPIGPGRRERAYLERVAGLESDLAHTDARRAELESRTRELAGELEIVSLLERGAERRLNRSERDLACHREELRRREQRESRLVLMLGALQNENQRLAHQLQQLRSAERPALGPRRVEEAPPGRGWRALLQRWLGG